MWQHCYWFCCSSVKLYTRSWATSVRLCLISRQRLLRCFRKLLFFHEKIPVFFLIQNLSFPYPFLSMKLKHFKMEISWNALISMLCNLSQLFFDIQHQAEDKASMHPGGIFIFIEKNNLCQTYVIPLAFFFFLFFFFSPNF